MKGVIKSCEILCVGSELLLGDIVNTNAAYLAQQLSGLGICVYHQSVVGDNPERLSAAVRLAFSRSDLVITSGGLGPTYDDLTRETVAATLGRELVLSQEVLDGIRAYFERMGRVMTDNNIRQAMVPCGATVLPNSCGTAPGLIVSDEAGEHTAILLPGPPSELTAMFEQSVEPYLKERTDGVLVSKNVHIFGMGESQVEHILRERMVNTANPSVAPYCKTGEVRLRVTARAQDEASAVRMCDGAIDDIMKSEVGPSVYAVSEANGEPCSMERTVVELLRRAGKTVATAESCTGGLVAKRLTDVPGASAVVLGGFVTYTNQMKQTLLGVSEQTLREHTEISAPVAAEMARGARERTGADVAVSVTGLAGPGGKGRFEAGTVFVGLSTEQGEQVLSLSLSPRRPRDYIRTLAATHALDLIRRALEPSAKET